MRRRRLASSACAPRPKLRKSSAAAISLMRSPSRSARIGALSIAAPSPIVDAAAPLRCNTRGPASGAHAGALRIERCLRDANCRAPLADQLHLETADLVGEILAHVAERDRLLHAVTEAARGDPADHVTLVPDGLIADRIGIARIDLQRNEPPLAATLFPLRRRCAADEVGFLEVDEATEACLIRPID